VIVTRPWSCVPFKIESTRWCCRNTIVCALNSIILAMAMKSALNLRFETLAANCIAVPFISTTYLHELSSGMKACSLPQRKHTMATLHECWTLMRNNRSKAVHIFRTIETVQNTILTLQGITIAMLDFNNPAEDVLGVC